MKRKIYLLFAFIISISIFCLSFNNEAYAKSYLSDKSETIYDVTSGLLTGKANTICQTDDGYIWIGQYAGLTRYDSKEFETMTSYKDYNLTSIVALANKGNVLFIGSEKGFFVKNEKNEITKIENLVVKDIKVWNDIVLVGASSGLYEYDITDNKMTRINFSSKNSSVSRIAIKNDEVYYFIVGRDEVHCNRIDGPIKDDESVKSITYYDNKLYLGTRNGEIIVYNITSNNSIDKTNELYCQPDGLHGTVNDILIRNDEIYLCCDAGLYYGGINDLYSISSVKSYGDGYSNIEKGFFDYENNLWLVSSSQGLYKISNSNITDYFFEYDLPKTTTYCIEKYHGYTFIGTADGVFVVDSNGKRIEMTDETDLTETSEDNAVIELINVIGEHSVRDIEVYNDAIYFATYGTYGNLFYLDLKNVGTEKDYVKWLTYDFLCENKVSKDESSKDYRSLRSNGKYLFVGLDQGVSRYDGENAKYIDIEKYPLYMTYNGDDLYVVKNTVGVIKASIEQFQDFELLDDKNNYSALKCLYYDDGILFSDNNDLYYIKNNETKRINIDMVGSVVDIAYINNKFYICTEAKVYVTSDLFKDKVEYDVIDAANGLKSSLVANSSGYYSEEENSYYFTTSKGILVYQLDSDSDIEKVQRKISIDYIEANGKRIDFKNKINLKSSNNNLTIKFSVLSYAKNQEYTVYYKLKGYDKKYQEISPDGTFEISYKNLDGGSYTFELYTKDFDGTLSANTVTFKVNKTKMITEYEAFWLFISFIILVICVALVMLYNRNRMKKTIKRQNEYKKITLESIEAIARTIDAKDSYTNGHSKRVGIYSREIAKALNLSEDEIDNIYYIALLHDIGKISIPLEILNKPGRLTDEEFNIMKTHTTAGGKILEGISTIPHIVEGAMYHHERYGGGGYPSGISGENIPFIARIICCADCYDAMATKRVYKDPYPKDKIISEFERCKGSQFDPKIADIVIKLIKEDRLRYGTELKKENNDSDLGKKETKE